MKVRPFFLCAALAAVPGCGGAPFTAADPAQDDGGAFAAEASAPDIAADIGPHTQMYGDGGADHNDAAADVAIDAVDAGSIEPDGGHADARGGEDAEAGTVDAHVVEAAPDAPPPVCVTDLAGIGTGDFHISFTITTTDMSVALALFNQRSGCVSTGAPYWEVTLSASGGIVLATSDGVSTHFVEAGNSVSDGQPHSVVVERVGGMISYWRDGVLGSAMSPDPDSLGSLPALTTGYDACASNTPASGHAALSGLCITRN